MDIILPLPPREEDLTEKRHRLTKLRNKVCSANLLLARRSRDFEEFTINSGSTRHLLEYWIVSNIFRKLLNPSELWWLFSNVHVWKFEESGRLPIPKASLPFFYFAVKNLFKEIEIDVRNYLMRIKGVTDKVGRRRWEGKGWFWEESQSSGNPCCPPGTWIYYLINHVQFIFG